MNYIVYNIHNLSQILGSFSKDVALHIVYNVKIFLCRFCVTYRLAYKDE